MYMVYFVWCERWCVPQLLFENEMFMKPLTKAWVFYIFSCTIPLTHSSCQTWWVLGFLCWRLVFGATSDVDQLLLHLSQPIYSVLAEYDKYYVWMPYHCPHPCFFSMLSDCHKKWRVPVFRLLWNLFFMTLVYNMQ